MLCFGAEYIEKNFDRIWSKSENWNKNIDQSKSIYS